MGHEQEMKDVHSSAYERPLSCHGWNIKCNVHYLVKSRISNNISASDCGNLVDVP